MRMNRSHRAGPLRLAAALALLPGLFLIPGNSYGWDPALLDVAASTPRGVASAPPVVSFSGEVSSQSAAVAASRHVTSSESVASTTSTAHERTSHSVVHSSGK